MSYFVSYVIITLFLLKSIDKIANNQSKTIASLEKWHTMLAHHAKNAVLLIVVVRAVSRTGSKVFAVC